MNFVLGALYFDLCLGVENQRPIKIQNKDKVQSTNYKVQK